jgi:hypothetical protein
LQDFLHRCDGYGEVMDEIAPGIRHWTAKHPNLGIDVSSYWLPGLRALLDPIAVPDGVDEVEEIVLSNRHHVRDALAAAERLGAKVRAPRIGMHEYDDDAAAAIDPYDFEEPLAGGAITPYRVTPLWPDDCVLHIPSVAALEVADAVTNYSGELEFVPERYMDDPTAEKRGLREGLARFAEQLEFEHLLPAHGQPIVGEGRDRLREFVRSG